MFLRKAKSLSILTVTIAVFILPLVVNPVIAADGANGYIQASSQIFHVSGAPLSINMWNLDVSSDYLLNWTGEATGISFTTGATETEHSHTFVLTSTSSAVTFTLRAQSAGTVVDQVQVPVVNIADFLATTLIISAGIFVLIIVIFKRVVK